MMTAAEYTRQVQEAAAYVRSALGGRRRRSPSHWDPALEISPNGWMPR